MTAATHSVEEQLRQIDETLALVQMYLMAASDPDDFVDDVKGRFGVAAGALVGRLEDSARALAAIKHALPVALLNAECQEEAP